MGALRIFVLFMFVGWLGNGPAHAEKRVALVVGNSAYKSVPRLSNPVHDAALVAAMFTDAGFDTVITKFDLDANEMRRTLREFGARAREADIAVVYYAGHGMEMDGNNYLIPTDAVLETDGEVLDETVPLERVLFAVESAKQLRLVILDACRDSPFVKTMKRTIASRGIGRGLAKLEPATPNTMIAFAAKAGSTASDGDSENGPFAKALVHNLPRPGLDLRLAFGYVRDDVLRNTNYQQEPYVYGSLGGDSVSLVPARTVDPTPNPQDDIRKDYELTLQLGTHDAWEVFLAHHPDGFYADLARAQLNKVAEEIERAKAKAAEQADTAAENAKMQEAAIERAQRDRKAIGVATAEKVTTEVVDKQAAADQAPNLPAQQSDQTEKVTALLPRPPEPRPTMSPGSATEMAKSIQAELQRVGCLSGEANGDWNSASQRALTLFNKHAGTNVNPKVASVDALDALRARTGRICPTTCDRGYRIDQGNCVRTTCRTGQILNADGECEQQNRHDPVMSKPDKFAPKAPDNTGPKQQSAGKCTSISQRCAMQIGGRCNPSSGVWEYGRNGAGGNTLAFNSCIGQMLARGKK